VQPTATRVEVGAPDPHPPRTRDAHQADLADAAAGRLERDSSARSLEHGLSDTVARAAAADYPQQQVGRRGFFESGFAAFLKAASSHASVSRRVPNPQSTATGLPRRNTTSVGTPSST